VSLLSEVRESRELIRNLTAREVKGKYKSTVLGQLWSLVNPLATMLVYTLVFGVFLGIEAPKDPRSGQNTFAIFLMCALLPWSFFTNVVNGGMNSLVGNDNLIKKVYFPRWALLVSMTLAALRQWLTEMGLLTLAVLAIGLYKGVGVLALPWLPVVVLAMVVLAVFALGVALALSIANVYFRDTQHFVSIALQIWFYLTPILYQVTKVTDQLDKRVSAGSLSPSVASAVRHVYEANPMYSFSEVFRSLMYHNRMPGLLVTLECLAWATVSILFGGWVFRRHQARLVEVL